MVVRRGRLLSFSLFVAVVTAMAWYVSLRVALFRHSAPAAGLTAPAAVPVPVPAAAAAPAAAPGDFFSDFRLSRDRARSAEREALQEMLGSQRTDETTRRQASQRYLTLTRASALETQVERLVLARGFVGDVVVHLGESGAQVVVRARGLEQGQVAQIADVVTKVTGVNAREISILSRD